MPLPGYGLELDDGVEQVAQALDDRQAEPFALRLVDRPRVVVARRGDGGIGRRIDRLAAVAGLSELTIGAPGPE